MILCCLVIKPCPISNAFSWIINVKLKCFKKVLTNDIIMEITNVNISNTLIKKNIAH